MATMLERNQKAKIKNKTRDEHAEDALYREVWEEVHAQKTYDFVKKYGRQLIAAAIAILIIVVGFQLHRHHAARSRAAAAEMFETALAMKTGASDAFLAAAKMSSGGMADLALWNAAITSENAKVELLAQLARDGNTRDWRDLAVIYLAQLNGDKMTADDFSKFLAQTQTKHSPYYYTGMMLVAQKYLGDGDLVRGNQWLDKIINDADAPGAIVANAQMLKQ
ncbi:MAG: hypothetical protein LBO08_03480 [Rickettsiales bacterium]|jgi:hypothetical protein|nr:hypothetical protein [Rickettsiales bacterium]